MNETVAVAPILGRAVRESVVLSADEVVAEESRLRAEDVELARRHPLFGRLVPQPYRVLTTRPHRRVGAFRSSANGVILAQQSSRMMAEWGVEATVLAVGAGCASEIVVGARVYIAQFSGTPLLDLTTGAGLDLWIVGEGEVLAVVDGGAS